MTRRCLQSSSKKSARFFQIESISNDGFADQELDLSNPKTFRNLAKPMGAQTDDRLAQYKKRYKDWEDPNGETFSLRFIF